MKDGFETFWTHEARKNLETIHEYLVRNLSVKEVSGFYTKLDKKIGMISKNPYVFLASEIKKNVRRCVLTDEVAVFFDVSENQIVILSIFDNRINQEGSR